MQYTLRDVPKPVDSALRKRAKAEGKSLNTVAIEALRQGLGLNNAGQPKRDLSFMGNMDDQTLRSIEQVREWSERIWPDEVR